MSEILPHIYNCTLIIVESEINVRDQREVSYSWKGMIKKARPAPMSS